MSAAEYLIEQGVQVVGFSGKAKSGKDYLAERTAIPWGFLPVALANHFKVDAVAKDGLGVGAAFWDDKTADERDLLQKRGTELGRDVYGQDVWLRHTEAWMCYYAAKGFQRFVVTDVRFVNEVTWVQGLGGKVYRITGRGGLAGATAGHTSETQLDQYAGFDRVFDNSPANGHLVITEIIDALHEDFFLEEYGKHRSVPYALPLL